MIHKAWMSKDSSLFYICDKTAIYMHGASIDTLEWGGGNDPPRPDLILCGQLLNCYASFEDISEGVDIEIHHNPYGPPYTYNPSNTLIKISNCQIMSKWITDITLLPHEYQSLPTLIYLHLQGETIEFHRD